MSENLNKLFSPVHVVETLTEAKVLDVYDTGKTFLLNSGTEFAVTLPGATGTDMAGWHATFIVKAAPSGASYTIVSAASDILGAVFSTEGADADSTAGTAVDTITLVDGKSIVGDRVVLFCDGTNFYARCLVSVTAAATLS